MNLQIIKSQNGNPEYVLLPISVYASLKNQIDKALDESEYSIFDASDYVDNPITSARIKAHITQQELADLMDVSQAYVSRIENQGKVSAKMLEKVKSAIAKAAR